MYSIRRWLYKPKRDDNSMLAQFFYADEDLNYVASELDSFDGRKDPERCTQLVNQLRQCQDKVLSICNQIMDEMIPDLRANRDFRVKFPDDVLQDNLAGQLWFGAECLAAGSSIMNREVESASMRPLAKALTKTLDNVRNLLREQCLRNPTGFSDKYLWQIKESLRVFDKLFAEFELSYVSAMVPVKTMREYDIQQNVIILFSETLQRALRIGLISQEMVDDYDPALMFTIPRLAIICGLLIHPEGPLNVDLDSNDMSEMFRPFQNLLRKIRELLWSLNKQELHALEKALCSREDPGVFQQGSSSTVVPDILNDDDASPYPLADIEGYVQKVCLDYPSCKQFISDFYEHSFTPREPSDEQGRDVVTEEENDDQRTWVPEVDTGEDLAALQESLSHALTKVIDRSATRDSGLHSDTCSNSSESSHNLTSISCTTGPTLGSEVVVDLVHDDDTSPDLLTVEAQAAVSSLLDDIVKSAVDCAHCANTPVQTSGSSDSWRHSRRGGRRPGAPATSSTVSSPSHTLHPKRHKVFHSHPCSPCSRVQRHDPTSIVHLIANDVVTGYSSSCSSCQSISSTDWDSDSCSSDTSSYNSECQDDEEIALAILAAEIASRNKARVRFCSVEDLIHRLFVCISGVADQLQTNYASDLRNILKYVFQMNCSDPPMPPSPSPASCHSQLRGLSPIDDGHSPSVERISIESAEEASEHDLFNVSAPAEEPPPWVPDELAPQCMSCRIPFTVVRRRHHCRNCGKVFCSRCSSNSVPLPRYGHPKPVRVCNRCFIYQVTPFLIEEAA